MISTTKSNTIRLVIVLSLASLSCQASAHWQNSLTLYLSNASCSKVTKVMTKQSGLETSNVPQDIHGQYELTADVASPSKAGSVGIVPTTNYLCWTNAGNNLIIPKITGTFANIDPTAWVFSRVFGGIGMTVTYLTSETEQFPCDDNTSIAWIETAGYSWCNKIPSGTTSTWGGKKGYNAWSVASPDVFTINSNWESINIQEREYRSSWGSWMDGVGITLYHRTYSGN